MNYDDSRHSYRRNRSSDEYDRDYERDERGGYRDRDREGYRSPRYSSRSPRRYDRSPSPRVAKKRFNNGENDAAGDASPSHILLARGLDARVSEEVFAKGMTKLYKGVDLSSTKNPSKQPTKIISTTSATNLGAQEGSLRRVMLIRDRETNESSRYGFAEFHSLNVCGLFIFYLRSRCTNRGQDAQAAMAKFNACDIFTISSKPIEIAYIHSGVFIPATTTGNTDFSFPSSGDPNLQLVYWDTTAFATEFAVSPEPPAKAEDTQSASDRPSGAPQDAGFASGEEPKKKKRKVDDGAGGMKKKVLYSESDKVPLAKNLE